MFMEVIVNAALITQLKTYQTFSVIATILYCVVHILYYEIRIKYCRKKLLLFKCLMKNKKETEPRHNI